VVIDAGDEASYIATPVWANDKLLGGVVREEKTHDAVSRIMLAATHVVDLPSVFGNNCHISYVPISLDNKSEEHRNDVHVRSLVKHE
jgi:hypothetical protein